MVDFSYPLLVKQLQNIDAIIIKPEDERMLRELRTDRLIYLSNHPSTGEPPVAYYVANRMGARFNFMASRQVFEWGYGVVGRFIQSIGAFSIIPGASDRESLKASRAILAKPRGKLVLYPEGEPTSGENDNLMPFQPGIAQLGFWALDDARKTDPDADIKILPSFVKYVMVGTDASIKAELHDSIARLEKRYSIDPGNKNLLRRFLTVGRVLLEETERDYEVPMAARDDFDYRIGRARHAILDGVAERVGVHGYDQSSDAIQKLRHILSVLEMVELKLKDPRLPNLSKSELEWARRESLKAYDVIVIKPGYLISRPTAERFFEWLARFENYAYGSTSPRPRKAHVFFGPVQRLSDFYDDYRSNKRRGVEKLTRHLRDQTQVLLDGALELSQPLVRPGDVDGMEI